MDVPHSVVRAALAIAVTGCSAPPNVQEYRLSIRVQGDPGVPLAGARVLRNGTTLGSSNEQGVVTLAAQGKEGSVLSLQLECPEGHRSPALPLTVVLRKVTERDRHPEYAASCTPAVRSLVVAVRAERGANLPVRYLGREVARTDASGTAHVLFKNAPDETVEFTLDTSGNPRLRPQNPSARFRVGQSDELVVFKQSFEIERPARGPFRPRETGPIRIR